VRGSLRQAGALDEGGQRQRGGKEREKGRYHLQRRQRVGAEGSVDGAGGEDTGRNGGAPRSERQRTNRSECKTDMEDKHGYKLSQLIYCLNRATFKPMPRRR
jgi:hypothetical protein